jgi:ubiquitin-protein ligase
MQALTIKRINGDLRKFKEAESSYFDVYPNPDNILEIFFLLIGREGTPFQGGHYIGKILHSPEYPRKAPDYFILTPNDRFEINKKICLSNSGYHPEDWAPAAWNLLTLLEGMSSVWHSNDKSDKVGISHINTASDASIKMKAVASIDYNWEKYPEIYSKFKFAIKNLSAGGCKSSA